MVTGFPLPSAEQVGLRPPSAPKQPFLILRGAMGVAIPRVPRFLLHCDRVHCRHLAL